MKKVNTLTPPTSTFNWHWRIMMIAIACVIAFYPDLVLAAGSATDTGLLPTGDLNIPGTESTDSAFKIIGYIVRIGVFLFIVMAMGFGMGTSIWAIFGSINDARQKEDWVGMMKQIIAVLIALAFALLIYVLAEKFVIKPIEAAFT